MSMHVYMGEEHERERERSVRDQSEISGDQPENSAIRERTWEISGYQGEINGEQREVSARSGKDQSEISGDR